MAEGVAWKLIPVRLFPSKHELSLDNDVILWDISKTMRQWLSANDACLMAADVAPALGQFSGLCQRRALNSGIRGLPPGFDLERRLDEKLTSTEFILQSELDEQACRLSLLAKQSTSLSVPTMFLFARPFRITSRFSGAAELILSA